jgi:hypothetical protein
LYRLWGNIVELPGRGGDRGKFRRSQKNQPLQGLRFAGKVVRLA